MGTDYPPTLRLRNQCDAGQRCWGSSETGVLVHSLEHSAMIHDRLRSLQPHAPSVAVARHESCVATRLPRVRNDRCRGHEGTVLHFTGEVAVSSDDRTRVHRVLATSLAILTTPLPQTAAPSAHDESLPHSPAMLRLMALAARVAPLDSTILITGESGVGKERLARWLHQASMRTRGPFIAVNCGAFADTHPRERTLRARARRLHRRRAGSSRRLRSRCRRDALPG